MTHENKVEELYALFEQRVTGLLHNCLWQILINNTLPNAAFIQNGPKNNTILTLQKGGYVSAGLHATSAEDTTLCDDLNREVYGHSKEDTIKITLQSMK